MVYSKKMQTATLRWFVFVLGAAVASGEEYVRVESPSDGRTYTIDTDQTSVRRSLRIIAASTVVAKLPAWLYPGADAHPSEVRYDTGSGIVEATFSCGGSQEQVVAFYTQALRGQGLRVSSVQLQENRGVHISGSNEAFAAGVRVQRQANSILVHTTYTPRQAPQNQHFTAVWYDDRTGILRLRDTTTGDEYEMNKQAIQENNLNRPGGVASDDESMPAWLPEFPGAQASPPGRIAWMFEPTAEFVTMASMRQVYDYYLEAVKRAGATLVSSQMTRSGSPPRDFSAKIVARKGDDQVEIQIGQMVRLNPIVPASRTGPNTAIGIRYSVPLQ
jgi:hypothetical protein